jgi:hypothetical protein
MAGAKFNSSNFMMSRQKRRMASVCQAVWKQPPVKDRWDSQVGMETTGGCLGQTPAEVLMLRQLEAATCRLSHESGKSEIKSKE